MKANDIPAGYVKQIEAMAAKAKEWRANHPGMDARVQFNFPRTVMVAACVSDAINNKFMSCNEAGLQLVKYISRWGEPEEATVLMLRVALEHEEASARNTEAMPPTRNIR